MFEKQGTYPAAYTSFLLGVEVTKTIGKHHVNSSRARVDAQTNIFSKRNEKLSTRSIDDKKRCSGHSLTGNLYFFNHS